MSEHLLGQPHHDGSAFYVDDPAPALGAEVTLRVHIPHGPDGTPGADQVVARAVRDGEPALTAGTRDAVDDAGTWWRVAVRADNPVTAYRFLLAGGSGGYRWLNGTGTHPHDVTDAADFRLLVGGSPPDWVHDQVAYQVFPDRFAPSGTARVTPSWAKPAAWGDTVVHSGPDVPRQWYGGDLDGVAQHLDHLTALGATLLYLTPFFEARSNHRYDAVSFDRVDPVLGGDEGLARLLDAAHARGIRVVGDLTLNHTGVAHEWFTRALADPASEEAGFYRFGAEPGKYESWLGEPSLPKLDHTSVGLRRRLYEGPESVVARWLGAGLDGWRIDVANMTGRLGADDLTHEVARSVRRTLTGARADAWLLAEHGHDASLDLRGDGWHGTMDYAGFTRPLWSWLNGGSPAGPGEAHGLQFLGLPVALPVTTGWASVATMRQVHAAMPWAAWVASTSHLDTHDTPRLRTVVGGGIDGWVDVAGRGRGRHLAGLALQMTMPGVPSVFMGDELGLTGLDGEHSRTPFPWDRRGEWDGATFDAYRRWTRLRHDCVALRRGGLRWVHAGDDSITFLREHPEQRVLVHVARADHPPVRLPLAALGLTSAAQPTTLVGDDVIGTDGFLVLPSAGPAAHAWALRPGGRPR